MTNSKQPGNTERRREDEPEDTTPSSQKEPTPVDQGQTPMTMIQNREETGNDNPPTTEPEGVIATGSPDVAADTNPENTAADAQGEGSAEDHPQAETEQADHADRHFMNVIEALIFASDEPLTFRQIKTVLEDGKGGDQRARVERPSASLPRGSQKGSSLTINRFRALVTALNREYEQHNRAFRIVEIAGGYSFQTVPEYGTWIGRLFAARSRRRLTPSALETLAIVAFRQPISKPAIEAIRGVNADHVIKSLLEKDLITIVGREDTVGRPLLYGTTKTFLVHFGLGSLGDLPKPREVEELFRDGDVPDDMDTDPESKDETPRTKEDISGDSTHPGDDDTEHPFFHSSTVNVGITLDESREIDENQSDAESEASEEHIIRNSQKETDEETHAEEESDD